MPASLAALRPSSAYWVFELSPAWDLGLGIGPGARPDHPIVGLDLGLLQPLDIREQPEAVALRLGGGEDHGLQADGIRVAELLRAEVAEVVERRSGSPASRASRRRSSRARVTRLVVPVLAFSSTSGQEPSGCCCALRNRTPSRIACSTCSLVTPPWRTPAPDDQREEDQADPASNASKGETWASPRVRVNRRMAGERKAPSHDDSGVQRRLSASPMRCGIASRPRYPSPIAVEQQLVSLSQRDRSFRGRCAGRRR